jgi:hypothetical protein
MLQLVLDTQVHLFEYERDVLMCRCRARSSLYRLPERALEVVQ